ncbi:MAG TPA: sugar ABC transporter substrate-binding protein [Actinocrinis sp.]|jgi:multiple sugar transport system substrate-binding protein
MRAIRSRAYVLCVAVAATVLSAAACGGGTGTASNTSPKTLTYWASDQGSSIADDQKVLAPELAAFQKQTGIKVNLEVISWSNLLDRVLAAASSGQGPDVLNIGNTWSASLQATGAFLPITDSVMSRLGDTGRFLPGALAATGASGKPPVGVPLYSLAYGLYYNKAMFAAAGITSAPATWEQLVADGQKLTHGSQWGITVEGGSTPENAHHAFIFSEQQGGSFFGPSGSPTFDTPQNIAGIQEYIDFLGSDKIADPSDAEYSNGTEAVQDFANGKAAMLLWQDAGSSLSNYGMSPSQYGVVPVPFPATAPPGGKHVDSIVAGINMCIFGDTKNLTGAEEFVKFMTGKSVQIELNKAYGSMPSVKDAYTDPAFTTPADQMFQGVLGSTAISMPEIAQESEFETVIGAVMKNLFADAAQGQAITSSLVAAQLDQAQQQMQAAG